MAKKMSLQPPTRTPEEFIKAANQPSDANRSIKPTVNSELPWNDSRVREDVIKSVNLRLDEPTLLKLKWLSEKTRKSQQEIIREALLPYLDSEIENIQ